MMTRKINYVLRLYLKLYEREAEKHGIIGFITTVESDDIIRQEDDKNCYVTADGTYMILSCVEDIDGSIERMIKRKFNRWKKVEKVICIEGRANREQRVKALAEHIEIFDQETFYEIKENIRWLSKGVNIPAIGYGAYKMHIINKIKNKWNREKKFKILGEWGMQNF